MRQRVHQNQIARAKQGAHQSHIRRMAGHHDQGRRCAKELSQARFKLGVKRALTTDQSGCGGGNAPFFNSLRSSRLHFP